MLLYHCEAQDQKYDGWNETQHMLNLTVSLILVVVRSKTQEM
jgi:hypothetical protein